MPSAKRKIARKSSDVVGVSAAPAITQRDQILEVATVHFAELGFKGSNLRDIAADLHVTATALYHHFNGKEALYQEVCLRRFALAASGLERAFDQRESADKQLLTFLELLMTLLEEDRVYFRLVQMQLLERSIEDLRSLTAVAFLPQFKTLKKLIKAVNPKCHASHAAFNLYTLALGYAQFKSIRLALPKELDVGQKPSELARLIFDSVLTRNSR